MNAEETGIRLLLVDDEEVFRRATKKILERRGFSVVEASTGEEALDAVKGERPEIVVLDLNMPGLSGIETLQRIREIDETVPVIILTGHGSFQNALAGIRLEIVDFLQKPVEIDLLGERIRSLLKQKSGRPLVERSISDLMMPLGAYRKVYADQAVEEVLKILNKVHDPADDPLSHQGQSASSVLVYDRKENFLGIIRLHDLLRLVVPSFLRESPYTTYFTGMFLAQCKVIGKRDIRELIPDALIYVEEGEPLMKAVHLMVQQGLVNLPVMKDRKPVGVLRESDVIKEIAVNLGSVTSVSLNE